MGDLTKNISRSEISCKCGCGFDTADIETINAVQECCDHFAKLMEVDKVVLDISSGCRCESHNKAEGGGKNSQHLKGRAVDFTIRGVSPYDVHAYLVSAYPDRFGIGLYHGFTHLDTRTGGPARWGG